MGEVVEDRLGLDIDDFFKNDYTEEEAREVIEDLDDLLYNPIYTEIEVKFKYNPNNKAKDAEDSLKKHSLEDAVNYAEKAIKKKVARAYYVRGLVYKLGEGGFLNEQDEYKLSWALGRKKRDYLCFLALLDKHKLEEYLFEKRHEIKECVEQDYLLAFVMGEKLLELLKLYLEQGKIFLVKKKGFDTDFEIKDVYKGIKGEYDEEKIRHLVIECYDYLTTASDKDFWVADYILAKDFYGKLLLDAEKQKYYYEIATDKYSSLAFKALADILMQNANSSQKDLENALYYYEKAAKADDIDAIFVLARYYSGLEFIMKQNGECTKEELREALGNYGKLAKDKDIDAIFAIAEYYKTHSDAPDERKLARKWNKKAYTYPKEMATVGPYGDRGNSAVAAYKYATLLEEDGNKEDAVEYFKKAAFENHLESLVYMGRWYFERQEIGKAYEYFEKAARDEDGYSLYMLGEACKNAHKNSTECIVKNDNGKELLEQAFEYYELASAKGVPEAMYELGNLYDEGECVRRDCVVANAYYQKAAELGIINAEVSITKYMLDGLGGLTNKKGEAVILLRKILEKDHNNVEAMLTLARCYETGTGVAKNLEEARICYQAAVDLGSEEAESSLAILVDVVKPIAQPQVCNDFVDESNSSESKIKICNDMDDFFVNFAENTLFQPKTIQDDYFSVDIVEDGVVQKEETMSKEDAFDVLVAFDEPAIVKPPKIYPPSKYEKFIFSMKDSQMTQREAAKQLITTITGEITDSCWSFYPKVESTSVTNANKYYAKNISVFSTLAIYDDGLAAFKNRSGFIVTPDVICTSQKFSVDFNSLNNVIITDKSIIFTCSDDSVREYRSKKQFKHGNVLREVFLGLAMLAQVYKN